MKESPRNNDDSRALKVRVAERSLFVRALTNGDSESVGKLAIAVKFPISMNALRISFLTIATAIVVSALPCAMYGAEMKPFTGGKTTWHGFDRYDF